MATLRLFANLREAAATSSVEVDGATVGEVLDHAIDAYGERFALGLPSAKVWVNGDPADRATAVSDSDEIALVPPVSGGATSLARTPASDSWPILALIVAVAVAAILDVDWFAFVMVGVGIAWLWDQHDVVRSRSIATNLIPQALALGIAVNAVYRFGIPGLAAGMAIGVIVMLTWTVLDERVRSLDSVAVTLLMGTTASLGAGGLTYVRLRSRDETLAFLAFVVAASVAAWLTQRYAPDIAGVDPNLAALGIVLAGGVVAGVATEVFTLAVAVLAAVFIGAGLLAGRALGSIVRWGPVVHTARAPGMLTVFDGPVLAAAGFFVAMALFG